MRSPVINKKRKKNIPGARDATLLEPLLLLRLPTFSWFRTCWRGKELNLI